MIALRITGLSKYWGAELLFKEINLLLNEGEKVALVGRNGTGKTTLLKIITGRMEHDEGELQVPAGCRAGYLSQDPEFTAGRTVLEEAQSVFAHLQAWEERLRRLEGRMSATASEEELPAVMEEYARLTARYEAAGAYEVPARVKAVLFGLGFAAEDLAKPVEVLSGGQKVRLGLARLLLEEPGLLLLDEPTNHLDLEATEWLEGCLKSLNSAALVISHDRYFLDQVTTGTLELENRRGEFYPGNFSWSREEKQRRQEATLATYERQQEEIQRLQAFYEKWRATPTRKNQALSRKRVLDKMEVLERPVTRHKSMKLSFNLDHQSGNDVLRVEGLAMAFDGTPLFSGVNLRVAKGDRVALVGPNGAGKTTLLKIVQGLLEPMAGRVHWGAGVRRGYFSQDLDDLDHRRTCLEEMLEIPGFTRFEAHSLLGRFLFSGDDAHKLIAGCSGGERNRLILAKLMVAGANLLLLDEPTNHLDLESKAVLEEALNEYPGTVLFVSHDRFFVDRVATKVWEFGVDGVVAYEGNYTAYKAEKARLLALKAQAPAPAPARPAAAERREPLREARTRQKEERQAAATLRRLEAEIQRREERQAELEELLADPDLYKAEGGREAVAEYQALLAELERLYAEWESAANCQ